MSKVTIEVERADIERLVRVGHASYIQDSEAAARVEAAIPEPEWEPSEEQIDAFALAFGYSLPRQRGPVVQYIKNLKEDGFTL